MPRPWSEIAPIIRSRRDQLGITQQEAASRANARMGAQVLSSANLGVIEAAGRANYRARTMIGLARALDWPDDAIDRLLEGDDPSTLEAPIDPDPDLRLSSNDIDLNALADEDPEAYEALQTLARRIVGGPR